MVNTQRDGKYHEQAFAVGDSVALHLQIGLHRLQKWMTQRGAYALHHGPPTTLEASMRTTPLPQSEVDEAERKVGAILDELEDDTNSEVKDIDLEDVVENDKESGQPAVHQAVEITVVPRAQRKWIK